MIKVSPFYRQMLLLQKTIARAHRFGPVIIEPIELSFCQLAENEGDTAVHIH